MIFVLTPILIRLWTQQARRQREPSELRKMAFGCICVTAAYLLMAVAANGAGPASPLWLMGYFAIATLGELCVAPIGLALVVTTAPARIRSMMMGVWFAATLPADILGRLSRRLLEQPAEDLVLPADRRGRGGRRHRAGGAQPRAAAAAEGVRSRWMSVTLSASRARDA